MSTLTLSMKMSPKDTGRLFSKACRLEDENKQLRAWVAELECMVRAFRACVDLQMVPSWGSPGHDQIHALVGKNTEEGT